MSNGTVGFKQPGGADRQIDNEAIDAGGGSTVYRQRIEVGGAALAEIARVLNGSATGSEYALAVRLVPANNHVDASLAGQTTGATVYSVTPGKKFYLVSYGLSWFNTSLLASGQVAVRDGASAVKLPFSGSIAVAGLLPPTMVAGGALPEPIPFSTDVRVTIDAGTVTYSVWVSGYEA